MLLSGPCWCYGVLTIGFQVFNIREDCMTWDICRGCNEGS